MSAGRDVRTMAKSPTRAADVRAIQDTGDVQPSVLVLSSEVDGVTDTERLDGTAGCEFVDDRIRLLE